MERTPDLCRMTTDATPPVSTMYRCRRLVSAATMSAAAFIAGAFSNMVVPVDSLSAAVALRPVQRVTLPTGSFLEQNDSVCDSTRDSSEGKFDEYEDDWENDIKSTVNRFHSLQKSTGREIMQAELLKQIDLGPRAFLEQQGSSSEMEKIAMSSVTVQLPQAAMAALNHMEYKKSNAKLSNHGGGLNFSRDARVSVEHELQLARTIQMGVALNKIKLELESKPKKSDATPLVSRLDWANAVGLSTKELRQAVSAYRQAKHDLVTANIGLVHAVVNQFYGKAKAAGISKEEMVQEGSLGLLRAAELFDPSRGLRFSTYAVVWIKGVLSNSHVPELVKLPAREKTKFNKIVRAQRELSLGDGSPVSIKQLADSTGITVSEIVETQLRMNQASNVLSLDYEHKMQSRSGTESGTLESTLAFDKNMQADEVDLVGRTQLQADVIAAMARNLDSREARLVRLRYGLSDGVSRTLQECADAMGLSYSRVHQLSERCLTKLREAEEAESLEEYLLTIA